MIYSKNENYSYLVTSESHLRNELQAVGLRVTAQRLAVFDIVREQRQHLRADEIIEATHVHLQTVSTQAVYSALSALCDAGLVRRIEPAGSAAMYEARVADNHHHVVCRACAALSRTSTALSGSPLPRPVICRWIRDR